MSSKTVIVVGAGIAGLSAATTLAKRNFDVIVLEAGAAVGGRMRTDIHGGYIVDSGAQFLSSGYTVINGLIEHANLEGHLANTSLWSGIVRNGSVRRFGAHRPWTLAKSGILSWWDFLRMVRGTCSLAMKSKNLPLNDYSQWISHDVQDAAEWIETIYGKRALEYVFEPMLQGFYFQSPESMSRAWPSLVWNFSLRNHSVCALKHGMASLPIALADKLDVRLNTAVESVVVSDSGVLVQAQDGLLKADYVVIATTSSEAQKIYLPLCEYEMQLLETRYSETIVVSMKMHTALKARLFESDIYGVLVPRKERDVIAAISVEACKCPAYVPSGELFNVMLANDACALQKHRADDDIVEQVMRELVKYIPDCKGQLQVIQIVRWPEAMPLSPIGRGVCLAKYRNRESSRMVLLAGDYMSTPCTEGAAESGFWAANAIESHERAEVEGTRVGA